MGALLTVEGLSKRYGAITVADEVGFSVEMGTCLGIIGPNGAGKTSLFNLLCGTAKADAGRIVLDGNDITRTARHKRAQMGIARAYQIPQPFPDLSVFENVLVGATFGAGLRGRQADEATMQALEAVGIADLRHAIAGGLTLLNRKRLELAKAIAARPRVLLLDEIAGGLTEQEVLVLVDFIKQIKPQFAMIWIEHVAHALTAVADRLLVLDFGKQLAVGAPREIMDSAIVKEIYLGLPADANS